MLNGLSIYRFVLIIKAAILNKFVMGAMILDVLLAPPGGCGVLNGKVGGGILNGGMGGAAIWA